MLLKAALLALLTLAVFWPSMHADFVYDDAHFVTGNDVVRFGAYQLNTARMLTLASYRVQFLTTGENPFYFHLANLGIHLLNGLMVFFVSTSVFSLDATAGLFASSVFLLHPLISQAVIYVSGRSELLALTFILLSVRAFSRDWRILAVALCTLAVESKEIALVTPALWWIVAQRQKKPLWPVVACFTLGLALSPLSGYLQIIRENANFAGFYAILSLLARSIVPIGLTIDHDFISQPWILGPIAACFIAGIVIFALITRRSIGGAMVLWIFALLLPHVLVEPPGYLAEQHMYAPMFGISILLALTIQFFTMKGSYEQL